MESLLASRNEYEEPSRLENLSPEKYGKAAFSSLTYTPSKLADNVLYKEFSNQKKLQQGSSKLRQTQASNSILHDRLLDLQQQKQGIEKALSDQILMYKKILKEKQEKNEKRVKGLQENFNIEIGRIMNDKQQEAKYAQAEKQLLERRIAQLEEISQDLRERLENVTGDHGSMISENEKLKIIQDSITKRLEDAEHNFKKHQEKSKEDIQQLKRKIQQTEDDWQRSLQKQTQAREKQIENLERLHRNELEKTQNKRVHQALLKNQQLKDLAATFDKQTTRLNTIITKKEQQISELGKVIQSEKQKAFQNSKGYENEITNLAHQKSRLKQQLLRADRQMEKLNEQSKELQERLHSTTATMQEQLTQTRTELQLNQINLMREVDNNQYSLNELTREVSRLKIQNQQLPLLINDNTKLSRELRNMKELLIESSVQMERCKEEFIRIGRERDMLANRLRQLGIENQTLYRIKNEREEEARGWRESYFTQKTNY